VKLKPRALYISRAARPLTGITHASEQGIVLRDDAARARRITQLSFLLLALISPACGKVGPPIPPARLTERTSDLSAIQRGSNILLQWPAPAVGQKESSRSYVARANIYRLDEQRDEEPVLDADDYEAEAQVIGYLDRATIEAQIKSLGRLEFTDKINVSDAGRLANTRLRYSVRYLNARNQAAAFSNTVAIEPAPGISLPPSGIRVEAPAQDVLTLTWSPPDANIDGTSPASVVGYNVYRRNAKRETGGRQINSEPVTSTNFEDKGFQYQTEYAYFVRALSQGANGLIESADSDIVTLTPVDRFAPLAPDPVSIASANGTISLFWPTSAERDVAGYNVYRSDSIDAQDTGWIKLTAQPITAVTFRDERVVIDRTYSYRVTAVDHFNNESEPSRVVRETAHP
jgi:hypothetical protein